jgi:HlyD family secretion protein
MSSVRAFLSARWRLLLFALVAVVLVAAGAPRLILGPEVGADIVVRSDFVQTVVASGRVETPNRVDIGAQLTGTVARVPVAEGQSVRAGDVLVELEAAELRATEKQAAVGVAQAEARLRQLRELQAPVAEQSLRQARINLDNARSALRRNQELFQKGFIGEAALDDSRKAVDLAEAQAAAARKQLETATPAGSDYALAQAALTQAQAAQEAAHARTRYAVIAAPREGVLIGRNVEVGDVVQPGKVLMTLSPAGRTQLVVEIDEKNLRLLALGQAARASADAYPQDRFEARLAYINPGINAQTGAVEVKLDVSEPPPVLKQDMTVSVDIEVARRPGALLLPSADVHDAQGPAPWVLRVEQGVAMHRPVHLGLRSGGFAEVVDGVSAGDAVVPPAAAVAEGSRVRIKPAPALR